MSDLRKSLAELATQAQTLKPEDTLRHYFIQALDQFVKESDLFSIESGPLFRLNERIIRGKPDSRIGGLTFEVKLPKPHGKGLPAAIPQVCDYIDESAQQGVQARGVAYDGESIAMLDEQKQIIFQGEASEGATLLASWLTLLAPAARKPEDMVNRFGSESALSRHAIKMFYELLLQFEPQIPFIQEVFTIWKAVYGCAANINKETIQGLRRTGKGLEITVKTKRDAERYVFATETYLSILLKVLVARVAVEKNLVSQPSVFAILCEPSGQEHIRYTELASFIPHLANVFEEDPFDWFIDAAKADKTAQSVVCNLLRCVAETIDNIRLVRMGRDFLQVFYQHFFDAPSRRALGEFYTNSDLVKEALDAVGFDGAVEQPIIDFCCGSGNFLIEVIQRIRAKGKHRKPALLLRDIESNVFGVDIHPLAVAMARVNFIIAVAPLLERGRAFRVPVYWADSLVRLSVKGKSRNFHSLGEPVKISIPGMKKFNLPDPQQFEWEGLFDFCRQQIRSIHGTADFDVVWQRFEQQYPPEKILPFEDVLKDFVRQLVERHNQGRDTRWLPMLRNILFLERQKGKFRYVVGNPPWVRIHNIDEELRKRINEDYSYCADAGWERGCRLAGIGRGFARQTDLCVPFVERAFELLAPGGYFSFVITSKVQQALYANALRRDLVTRKTLVRISDYSLAAVPLFEGAVNYPLVLSVKNEDPAPDSECHVEITNSQQQKLIFEVSQKDLSLLPDDPESPWMMAPPEVVAVFRKMQANGQMLGEDDTLRPRRGVMTGANEIFIVTRIEPTDSPKEVMVTTEGGTTVRIEKEMLRPLIRGRDVSAWGYSVREAIIWTHNDSDGEVVESLPDKTEKFFSRQAVKGELERRDDFKAGMPIWTIFRVSAEKLGLKVAWKKYGTEMQSTVLEQDHDLDLTGGSLLVPLQTVYFIPVRERKEGLFLAGVFNSIPFKTLMMAFAVRARGAYFHYIAWIVGLGIIPLTPGASEKAWDGNHRKAAPPDAIMHIEAASKHLHGDLQPNVRASFLTKLQEAVADAFHLTAKERKYLQDYYLFMRPPQKELDLLEEEPEEGEAL